MTETCRLSLVIGLLKANVGERWGAPSIVTPHRRADIFPPVLRATQVTGRIVSKGRVVLFTTGLTEPGGCARHASTLAAGLADRGWDVLAVCRNGTLRRLRIETSPGLRVIELPGFGRRIGAPFFLTVALPLGLLCGWRAKFMSFQLSAPTLAAGICSLILRRPFIALATTSGENSETAEILHSPGRWPYRKLLARASYVVGQTTAAAEELRQLAAPGRVAVVPTPLPRGERLGLSGCPNVVYTGRLTEGKDLPLLLGAWEAIVRERPQARLTLVGEGGASRSVEPTLRRMVAERPLLACSVQFTGWVTAVEPYLRRADVFVFPSRSEGMSNSLLEACAWRRVVVASDIPPNRSILGDDYPLLYPLGDESALAEALRKALDDPPLRQQAVDRVESRLQLFSVDEVLNRLEALLDAAHRPRH
jgi:glycosyltransferase involved in cell wall biosynthesis